MTSSSSLVMLTTWWAIGTARSLPTGRLPAPALFTVALAWRVARVHHFRGDLDQALENYGGDRASWRRP